MRTELDARMDATMAALTGEGGMLPLASVRRWGTDLPVIAAAPPTVTAYLAHYCAEHAEATFLVAGDERVTFGALHAVARRVAWGLAARGIGKGDRVGIAGRNSPAWIATYMGVLMAGGVATLLNGWWQSAELAAAIEDVDCALVVADGPRAKRLASIDGLDGRIVALDETAPLSEAVAPLMSDEVPLPAIGPDDLATILFTSGSTGRSKGAASDHRAVVQAVFSFLAQTLMALGIATQDGAVPEGQPATMMTLPLFHVTAEIPLLLQSFAMARKLVLLPKWDAVEAMRLIEAERVSYFIGVPLMSFEMLCHPDRPRYDLSSVTDFASGGAPRPAEHVRRLHDEMGGGAPLIGYGLTETNAAGATNWRGNYLAKPDSTGRASKPLIDVAIVDEAGDHLPPGAIGEIAMRSIANFREYWNNPAATAEAFTGDGYFRTGDLGYLDEDGYIFIVDRKKDIIIRGGENISCPEVEAALYAHPAVLEAAVFGLPDERLGEVPAAVVWADGADLDDEALRAFLKERLAPFKLPTRIWFAEAPLPRLGTEKIDKVALKAVHRERLAAA